MAAYRFEKIDSLSFPDHYHLVPDKDSCYYLMKYTSQQDFNYSDENALISNLKKTMDKAGKPEWRYKEKAINNIAKLINECINDKNLARGTFVPIPPSKAKTDPLYDDRLLQILIKAFDGRNADIRELLYQKCSMEAFHLSTDRGSKIIDLQSNVQVNEELCQGVGEVIYLFDDILTTGAHFMVCKEKLQNLFPDKKIIGLFVARRIFDYSSDFNDS